MHLDLIVTAFCALGMSSAATAPDGLPELLEKMNQAAAEFRTMSAKVKLTSHTAVIDDNTVENGEVHMKRGKSEDMEALLVFPGPSDEKTVALHGHVVELYYPKLKLVQEYDFGKHVGLLEQYLLLGFGTSGKDLMKSYSVRLLAPETVEGQKTAKIELIPKTKEIREQLTKVEIWLAESGAYPVQQKFYRPSKDYTLITYTGYQSNPPLSENELRLKVPKDVKKEYPGK